MLFSQLFASEIFSSDQGAKEERGGVAAPRRTSDDEGNAELAKKARSHQRIISKCLSSHVSSTISMNLLQIVLTMLITPW